MISPFRLLIYLVMSLFSMCGLYRIYLNVGIYAASFFAIIFCILCFIVWLIEAIHADIKEFERSLKK